MHGCSRWSEHRCASVRFGLSSHLSQDRLPSPLPKSAQCFPAPRGGWVPRSSPASQESGGTSSTAPAIDLLAGIAHGLSVWLRRESVTSEARPFRTLFHRLPPRHSAIGGHSWTRISAPNAPEAHHRGVPRAVGRRRWLSSFLPYWLLLGLRSSSSTRSARIGPRLSVVTLTAEGPRSASGCTACAWNGLATSHRPTTR